MLLSNWIFWVTDTKAEGYRVHKWTYGGKDQACSWLPQVQGPAGFEVSANTSKYDWALKETHTRFVLPTHFCTAWFTYRDPTCEGLYTYETCHLWRPELKPACTLAHTYTHSFVDLMTISLRIQMSTGQRRGSINKWQASMEDAKPGSVSRGDTKTFSSCRILRWHIIQSSIFNQVNWCLTEGASRQGQNCARPSQWHQQAALAILGLFGWLWHPPTGSALSFCFKPVTHFCRCYSNYPRPSSATQ